MSELTLTPAEKKVAVGIATKLGIAGTVILGACSALTTILVGYHGHDTRLLATLATIVGVATILGRMAQAIAKELSGKLTFGTLGEVSNTLTKGASEVEGEVRKPTTRRPKP